jgi:hypothetical protein
MLDLPFLTGLIVIFKVKCWSLSSLSLHDIYLLKILVVPTCEIAKDVMFHKSPPFIVKRKFLLFVPRDIMLWELQITRFTSLNVRGCDKYLKAYLRLKPRVKFFKPQLSVVGISRLDVHSLQKHYLHNSDRRSHETFT